MKKNAFRENKLRI